MCIRDSINAEYGVGPTCTDEGAMRLWIALLACATVAAEHAEVEITWPCRDHRPVKHLYIGQPCKVCWAVKGFDQGATVNIGIAIGGPRTVWGQLSELAVLSGLPGVTGVNASDLCHTFNMPTSLADSNGNPLGKHAQIWLSATGIASDLSESLTLTDFIPRSFTLLPGAQLPEATPTLSCQAANNSYVQVGASSISSQTCFVAVSSKPDGTCCASWEADAGCQDQSSVLSNIHYQTNNLLTHAIDENAFEGTGMNVSRSYAFSASCKDSLGRDSAWTSLTAGASSSCAPTRPCCEDGNWDTRVRSTVEAKSAFPNGAVYGRHRHLVCAAGGCKSYGQGDTSVSSASSRRLLQATEDFSSGSEMRRDMAGAVQPKVSMAGQPTPTGTKTVAAQVPTPGVGAKPLATHKKAATQLEPANIQGAAKPVAIVKPEESVVKPATSKPAAPQPTAESKPEPASAAAQPQQHAAAKPAAAAKSAAVPAATAAAKPKSVVAAKPVAAAKPATAPRPAAVVKPKAAAKSKPAAAAKPKGAANPAVAKSAAAAALKPNTLATPAKPAAKPVARTAAAAAKPKPKPALRAAAAKQPAASTKPKPAARAQPAAAPKPKPAAAAATKPAARAHPAAATKPKPAARAQPAAQPAAVPAAKHHKPTAAAKPAQTTSTTKPKPTGALSASVRTQRK
eukprot:TRINITY_DN1404_c0_g1_i7.p1 TRINITY_DN1404_c0_g1~~TRINITY_DN1404_c0_g1_i7.p1  ORF type:complete len:681 (+),score=165.26 TRINITY_DN1404_c0_g1_i7:77-2119(+)